MMANVLSSSDKPVSSSRPAPLHGARLALLLLLSINMFNYIDRQMLSGLVEPIREAYFPETAGAADKVDSQEESPKNEAPGQETAAGRMGWLQAAFMFSYMILAPLFGWLADRMSRWKLIGVGVILWSLASGASGLNWHTNAALGFWLLLLTRCFVGVGEAAYGPAAPTIISDLYPVAIRGWVLSAFYAAIPVGSALGYAHAGLVLKFLGDWRLAFYLVVPPGLLLGLCCFFMPEPHRGQADAGTPSGTRQARWADYLMLLRTPSYVLVTLGMTAMTFAMGGIAFWMPVYIRKVKHAPDLGTVNLVFGGIVGVSALVATLLGGLAGDKLRARFPGSYFLVSGCSMLLGFPMVLLVLWAPYPWYWLFILLACFCLFFNTGPTNTVLANVTHPAVRASAFALNIFILHALGDAISPTVIEVIKDHSSLDVGFLVVSGMILLGGLLWLWGARYLARDTALAPTRLAGGE
jgi:MFS family permease